MQISYCLIWNTPADGVNVAHNLTRFIDSPRCAGKYAIHESAVREYDRLKSPEFNAKLTTWIIDNQEGSFVRPLSSATPQEIASSGIPEITTQVLTEVSEALLLSPQARAFRILTFLGSETKAPGDTIRFANDTAEITNWDSKERHGGCYVIPPPVNTLLKMLAWAECQRDICTEDLRFLLNELDHEGLIHLEWNENRGNEAIVTLRGHMCLEAGQLAFT